MNKLSFQKAYNEVLNNNRTAVLRFDNKVYLQNRMFNRNSKIYLKKNKNGKVEAEIGFYFDNGGELDYDFENIDLNLIKNTNNWIIN